MKFPVILTAVAIICIAPAIAQVEIPANPMVQPKKGSARSVGGGLNGGISVEPSGGSGMVRHVTHVILSQPRVWTNQQGRPLQAPLIAYEDLVVESAKGSPLPKMPSPPAKPTLIREGKIRLLVNQKPVEVVLATLSPGDQEYVEIMRDSIAKKSSSKK